MSFRSGVWFSRRLVWPLESSRGRPCQCRPSFIIRTQSNDSKYNDNVKKESKKKIKRDNDAISDELRHENARDNVNEDIPVQSIPYVSGAGVRFLSFLPRFHPQCFPPRPGSFYPDGYLIIRMISDSLLSGFGVLSFWSGSYRGGCGAGSRRRKLSQNESSHLRDDENL